MCTTPLDKLQLLVGRTALQEAEASLWSLTQNDSGTQTRWSATNEDLEDSDRSSFERRSDVESPRQVSAMVRTSVPVGQITDPGVEFCPIIAVSRIHHKYKDEQPEGFKLASSSFFSSQKFWKREWPLYYVSSRFTQKPVLFVKAEDVQKFLAKINERFNLDWSLSNLHHEEGFLLTFQENGLPRPRFLGISTKKADFDELQKDVPAEIPKEAEALANGLQNEDGATIAFREKMRKAFALSVVQARPSKKQKEVRRQEQKEFWCRQLRRTQRYLGLREAIKGESPELRKDVMTFEDEEKALESLDKARRSTTPELDTTIFAPHPFDSNVVFVCIDIEAYEGTRDLLTEIGISSLDTRDIVGLAPGQNGENWFKKVRARHFRIQEHSGYVNGLHVTGCPDRFEKTFGESEWISLKDIPKSVDSCFKAPFCAQRVNAAISEPGPGVPGVGQPGLGQPLQPENSPLPEEPPRNIIFVGHAVSSDVDFLRRAGYDVKNLSNVLEIVDTQNLFKALKHDTQAASVGTILQDVGIEGWNLHNAGNDAAYTLQALVGIAVKGLAPKAIRSPQTKQERIEKAQQAAAKNVSADWDEWDAASDNGDDGGEPPLLELDN